MWNRLKKLFFWRKRELPTIEEEIEEIKSFDVENASLHELIVENLRLGDESDAIRAKRLEIVRRLHKLHAVRDAANNS